MSQKVLVDRNRQFVSDDPLMAGFATNGLPTLDDDILPDIEPISLNYRRTVPMERAQNRKNDWKLLILTEKKATFASFSRQVWRNAARCCQKLRSGKMAEKTGKILNFSRTSGSETLQCS